MLRAPNLSIFDWLVHGFGQRDSSYPEPITTLNQIHSDTIVEAAEPSGDRIADGDALISRQPGLLVGVRTADCVPVLLVDRRTRAVASVHAGWRGTASGIVASTVRALTRSYGSKAEDISAAIGPSIGVCCYEVGPDVARQLGMAGINHPVHLNLSSLNANQLRENGVQDIWEAQACTFCEADRYFSFRREKEQAGRMVSYIGTKPEPVI